MKRKWVSIIFTLIVLFICFLGYLETFEKQFNPVAFAICIVLMVIASTFSFLSIRNLLVKMAVHRFILLFASIGAFATNIIAIINQIVLL